MGLPAHPAVIVEPMVNHNLRVEHVQARLEFVKGTVWLFLSLAFFINMTHVGM